MIVLAYINSKKRAFDVVPILLKCITWMTEKTQFRKNSGEEGVRLYTSRHILLVDSMHCTSFLRLPVNRVAGHQEIVSFYIDNAPTKTKVD